MNFVRAARATVILVSAPVGMLRRRSSFSMVSKATRAFVALRAFDSLGCVGSP